MIKLNFLYAALPLLLLFLGQGYFAPGVANAAEAFATPELPAGEAELKALPDTSAMRLSEAETLTLAGRFLQAGKPDVAEKLYLLLQRSTKEEIRVEASFQLAQIKLLKGEYRQAISMFLAILRQHPQLSRIRLELARAYFLDKNYSDAAFQFELVKGGDLPPEVLANVDKFLDAIRRQKNWTLDFTFSPVFDSNMNQASGGKEECIVTVFGLFCRKLEQKDSGYGLSGDAMLNYFWRFHQDWGLRYSLGASGSIYQEHDYDDYSLYTALGPRYLWDSGEASLQGTFRKRWVSGDAYNDEYGLRLDAQKVAGKFILSGGASGYISNYADGYLQSILEGPAWSLRIQPRYILTGQTFVQAGLEFLREEAAERSFANDNWRYSLGLYHVFPYGFSLFAEGSLTNTGYKAAQWHITRDHRIDETIRRDRTRQLFLSLSSNIFERYGLTPMLQFSYSKRDSNIWSREYIRRRVNLLLNYKW